MIIKKLGELALDIQKTSWNHYWLNIMQKCKDSDSYYVICGFEYDDHEDIYELKSVCNRIVDDRVNWTNLEILVKTGFSLLEDKDQSLEDLYKAQLVVVAKCNTCGKEHHIAKYQVQNLLDIKCPYCRAEPKGNWTLLNESTYQQEIEKG